ncbi:MAG: hypothetical protein QMC38_01990 [Sinobacterium sp.]
MAFSQPTTPADKATCGEHTNSRLNIDLYYQQSQYRHGFATGQLLE